MQQISISAMIKYPLIILLAILSNTIKSNAYSLLTHEAIIDVSWKKSIEPLLLQKYPGSSAEQLVTAHAYAYGGAVMPDIGFLHSEACCIQTLYIILVPEIIYRL